MGGFDLIRLNYAALKAYNGLYAEVRSFKEASFYIMIEIFGALILPVILIPFLVRVTYNRWVAIGLSIVIMIFIFMDFESYWTVVTGVIGTLIGGYFSFRVGKKVDKKWS